jgi:hypothetical protein
VQYVRETSVCAYAGGGLSCGVYAGGLSYIHTRCTSICIYIHTVYIYSYVIQYVLYSRPLVHITHQVSRAVCMRAVSRTFIHTARVYTYILVLYRRSLVHMYACAYAYEVSRTFIYHICILHSRSLVQHVRMRSLVHSYTLHEYIYMYVYYTVGLSCSMYERPLCSWRGGVCRRGGCVGGAWCACGRRSLCVCAHAGGGRYACACMRAEVSRAMSGVRALTRREASGTV